ncbi:hypothetical protein [Tsuneonella suprasediminis]|uniref:hypothetical protein n=1 Tax=Tsuneonella suprasediminis TaxID=2306996 RepID=UPI002F9464AB
MTGLFSSLLSALLKIGVIALILNEVRGVVLAVPVIYAIYQSGGTLMAFWIGFCSLAGIALSVLVPMMAMKKVQKRLDRASAVRQPALAPR